LEEFNVFSLYLFSQPTFMTLSNQIWMTSVLIAASAGSQEVSLRLDTYPDLCSQTPVPLRDLFVWLDIQTHMNFQGEQLVLCLGKSGKEKLFDGFHRSQFI
jgi:hypothetical protein